MKGLYKCKVLLMQIQNLTDIAYDIFICNLQNALLWVFQVLLNQII